MEESILTSIKRMLGITEDCVVFDAVIIAHINSVLSILKQLGVGPSEGFKIEDESATWSDFIEGNVDIESVKTYVYLKVKEIFDPPTNSTHMASVQRLASELEWRLNLSVETE